MRTGFLAAALVVVPALAGCLNGPLDGNGQSPLEAMIFSRFVVDPNRQVKEPSLVLSQDGIAYICGPRSLGSGSDLWRSRDGLTFEYLALQSNDVGPPLRSGSGDVGGGDCDVAVDEAGNAYLADLWAGSVSIATTRDQGETWTGVPVSLLGPDFDRPWALGGTDGELIVAASAIPGGDVIGTGTFLPVLPGGLIVARSTDHGRTFEQVVVQDEARRVGKTNIVWGADALYIGYGVDLGSDTVEFRVARSEDRGATWTHHPAAEFTYDPTSCPAFVYFPALAADAAGGVYLVWNLVDPGTHHISLFFAASPDRGETWHPPRRLVEREGTVLMPWIAASGAGRVGVAWYETALPLTREFVEGPTGQVGVECENRGTEDAEWYLHYAFFANAADEGARFNEVLVQPEPVHRGSLDGPFAEFMQVEFDPQGRAAIAYVADVSEGSARPVFALQTAGALGKAATGS